MKRRKSKTITCLGWAMEPEYFYLHPYGMIEIPAIQRPFAVTNLWWLDEDMEIHTLQLGPKDPAPHFEVIKMRGLEVVVKAYGGYEVTYSPA